METEKEKEMEKKYSVLHKKLDNLESQLTPIFSESLNTETTPSHNIISEAICQDLHFVNKLLTAEMASNLTPCSGRDENRHLAQIANRVRTLQSVCRAWSNPRPTSFYMEMSEAPRCSYIDPFEDDHVDEEEDELGNSYDDHVDGEGFSFYENPVFVSHGDHQDELAEFGEVGQDDDQDQDDEETVMEDSDTAERAKNAEEVVRDDDQNEVEECKESRMTEDITRVYYDQKEEMTKIAEEDGDDGYDNEVKTHYCYKVVFWVGLIGMGIISVMAGFSDFPEYHSSVTILTPT